jgi:effector-binding domain-containing protein
MKAPHMGMDEYMKEKSLTQTLVLEEYVTDPMTEKDTAKWQTNIYYLVK